MSDDDSVEPIETYEQKKETPLWKRWLLPAILFFVLLGNWAGIIDLSPENERTIRDMIHAETAPLIGDLEAQLRAVAGTDAAPPPATPQGLLDIQNFNLELGNRDAQIAGLQEQVNLYEAQVTELQTLLRDTRSVLREKTAALDTAVNTCMATTEIPDDQVCFNRDDYDSRVSRYLGVLDPS